MAKTRISISLEQEQAERIRQHAERAGLDVSAYLVHAATRQMAETDAIEAQFAGVDALIAAAEAEAADAADAQGSPRELTAQERREVEAALALVYGPDRSGARPGEAA
ncbi:ribbon-helix-helix protein, CopG family [Streptomyces sp. NPDC006529]|uniref:plasmid mobilization protein n=1 Tax=Streptomyces sp. NPDC006529 TaxID=3157177 RepID=UPI0033B8423D